METWVSILWMSILELSTQFALNYLKYFIIFSIIPFDATT